MTDTSERLRRAFGTESLARVRARLRERLERGGSLETALSIRGPDDAERRAVEGLLGRPPGRGSNLTFRPAELDVRLRETGLAAGLREALELLDGPLRDRATERAAEEEAWRSARSAVDRIAGSHPLATAVWDDLEREGQVRRAAEGSPVTATELARQYVLAVTQLPSAVQVTAGATMPLAELAARSTGDAHGLDPGAPLGALVQRYAARLAGVTDWTTASDRRALWKSVGIELDPLSSDVLVLNLPARGGGPVAASLSAHAAAGEPCRLTLRALERHPFEPLCRHEVFVCENPTVVLAAARSLGASSAPLVCLEGQPSTAADLLFRRLRHHGAQLRYHGDFDWPGLRIATLMIERHHALPWRLDAASYLQAPAGPTLRGEPIGTPWDPELSEAMARRGRAVHEEGVMGSLLPDLVVGSSDPERGGRS